MERIAAGSEIPNLKPRVFVINANVLNTFALPGGNVYVFRGLIDSAQSEAEVMGVLGHEWAQVTARYGTKGMSKTIGTIFYAKGAEIALRAAAGEKNKLVKFIEDFTRSVNRMIQSRSPSRCSTNRAL
jgi:predicted Zn-dependent protease